MLRTIIFDFLHGFNAVKKRSQSVAPLKCFLLLPARLYKNDYSTSILSSHAKTIFHKLRLIIVSYIYGLFTVGNAAKLVRKYDCVIPCVDTIPHTTINLNFIYLFRTLRLILILYIYWLFTLQEN
jgi:hypothetical protein